MNNGGLSDGRGEFPVHSRGNSVILLKRCCAMYLNFPCTANSISLWMPAAIRAWPKKSSWPRGLMRFRIAEFRLGYKLTVEKRKRRFFLCYAEML